VKAFCLYWRRIQEYRVLVSVRMGTASLAFAALLGTRGFAQRPTCPKSDSAVARPCELDPWPLGDTRRLKPLYPDILRQARVAGEVQLRYVVDTAGRTVLENVEVLRSTHELFTNAVKRAMPLQRLEPPRRAGVLTKVTIEELVTFEHPGPNWKSAHEPVIRHGIDSTGRLMTTVYAFPPRDSTHAPRLTSTDSVQIYEAVVAELMRMKVIHVPPVAWCVQLGRRAPSPEMFARWRAGGRRVVTIAECPKTYASMVYTPGDAKRPRGWVDPVQIAVDTIASWAEDTVLLTTRTGQGMASNVNMCEAVRVAGKWTVASCVTTEHRIS
jgi:hypothetical protein